MLYRWAHRLPRDDPSPVLQLPASLCSIRSSNGSLFKFDYVVIVNCPNHYGSGTVFTLFGDLPPVIPLFLLHFPVRLPVAGMSMLAVITVRLFPHPCLHGRKRTFLPEGERGGCYAPYSSIPDTRYFNIIRSEMGKDSVPSARFSAKAPNPRDSLKIQREFAGGRRVQNAWLPGMAAMAAVATSRSCSPPGIPDLRATGRHGRLITPTTRR